MLRWSGHVENTIENAINKWALNLNLETAGIEQKTRNGKIRKFYYERRTDMKLDDKDNMVEKLFGGKTILVNKF